MSVVNYGKKRFLIVDNIKPSRDALKQLAISLNADRIDSTLYPNDVITMCENIKYDIIFLGYDLGEDQKNGQQILEELRITGGIGRQCIVIIITAEISQEMVLAALEHKPDDYLTKPYTINDLTTRLDRCLKKKVAMSDIYQALDDKNMNKVVRLCDQKIKKDKTYKLECLGIKSRQHYESQQFKQAKKIYLTYQDTPNCQWAIIGLGKIALLENDAPFAISLFKQLISSSPYYLSSYDWLSQAYITLDKFDKAEEVLDKAVQVSPRSVVRLKAFAEICFNNEKYEKAALAYLTANELAYNSIHHNPNNALNFARALTEYSADIDIQQAKRLNNKAFKALALMTKEFKKIELKIQSNLLSACLYKNTKEFRQSTDMLKEAKKTLDKLDENVSPISLVEMSKSFIKLQENKAANQLMTSLIERCHDDLLLMTEVDKLEENTLDNTDKSKAQRALNVAASLYKNRDYNSAIKKLRRAMLLYPSHIGIRLNLLQVLLVSFEIKRDDLIKIEQASSLIKSFREIEQNNRSYLRFEKLNDKYKQLKQECFGPSKMSR
jgi:DNA-binding response OmpR family regulator/TolA-binding protein